jgi:hypothetical protein
MRWTPVVNYNDGSIVNYRIYRDGVRLPGETYTTQYADREVEPGATYTYQVSMVDAAGKEGEKSEPLKVTLPATLPNDGRFEGIDKLTKGNWRGVYGADGYVVIGAGSALPDYAKITGLEQKQHVWAADTPDDRALLKQEGDARIAACYHGKDLTIDIRIANGQEKPVAFYLLDWDRGNRAVRCELLDGADNEIIDARDIHGYANGFYLRYQVKGHIRFRFKALRNNAVLSGIFFGFK